MVNKDLKIIGVLLIIAVVIGGNLFSFGGEFNYRYNIAQITAGGSGSDVVESSIRSNVDVPSTLDNFDISYCAGYYSNGPASWDDLFLQIRDSNDSLIFEKEVEDGVRFASFNYDAVSRYWGDKKVDFKDLNRFEMDEDMFNSLPIASEDNCFTYDLTNEMKELEGEEATVLLGIRTTGLVPPPPNPVESYSANVLIGDPIFFIEGENVTIDPVSNGTEFNEVNDSSPVNLRGDSYQDNFISLINDLTGFDISNTEFVLSVVIIGAIVILLIYRRKL